MSITQMIYPFLQWIKRYNHPLELGLYIASPRMIMRRLFIYFSFFVCFLETSELVAQANLPLDHPFGHIVTAYHSEFGYTNEDFKDQIDGTISLDQLTQMCYEVINSPTCEGISAEDVLKCDDLELSFSQRMQQYTSGVWNTFKEPVQKTLLWFASPFAVKLKTTAQVSRDFDDTVQDIALAVRNEWIENYDDLDAYNPRSDFYPYNLVSGVINSIGATGLMTVSGISSVVASSLQDVYQSYQQFQCFHLERQAEIATFAVLEVAETTLVPARSGSNALKESIARAKARYERNRIRKVSIGRDSGAKRRRNSRQQNRVENRVFQSTQITLSDRVKKNIRDMRRAGAESRVALNRFDWLRDDIRDNGPMNVHSRWRLAPIKGTNNKYKVHVKEGSVRRGTSYVACFELLDDNSIEFIFFGTHETTGLTYNNCRRP